MRTCTLLLPMAFFILSLIHISRGAYWRPKLENNVRRDKRNVRALRRLGWRVLIVWECEAKSAADEILRRKLRNFLRKR